MNLNIDDASTFILFPTLQVISLDQEWELPLRRTFESYHSSKWTIRTNILRPIEHVLLYKNFKSKK